MGEKIAREYPQMYLSIEKSSVIIDSHIHHSQAFMLKASAANTQADNDSGIKKGEPNHGTGHSD